MSLRLNLRISRDDEKFNRTVFDDAGTHQLRSQTTSLECSGSGQAGPGSIEEELAPVRRGRRRLFAVRLTVHLGWTQC